MRKNLLLPLLISLFVTSCMREGNDRAPAGTEPDRVSLAAGKVSFVPPIGFRPLTAEEIKLDFPGETPPQYVFTDASKTVSVRIGFSPARSTPDMLDELKAALEESFPKLFPGLKWQDRAIVEIGGTRWINLRFTNHTRGVDLVNDMYVTPFEGSLVIFSYNAEVDKWEASRQFIEASKASIRLRS